jgi:Uma2 family endonuclease
MQFKDFAMSTVTNLMTAEKLSKLPGGNFRYELIKGELLTMSPAGEEHGAVIVNLTVPLGQHVKAFDLGVVYGAETGFKIASDPDTVLAPDIAFIRRERVGSISKGYRQGTPDLAVEVISPSESKSRLREEVQLWLQAGASGVWVVNPQTRMVAVHRPKTEPRLLSQEDVLTGDDIVPGFRFPVSEIFC